MSTPQLVPMPENRYDLWLSEHSGLLPRIVLGLGFLARVWAASGTFLNADEAQHFLVSNRPSLAMAYKSSLTLAHPPLLIVVLYFWRTFGTSEFALRMLSVCAGILFCWTFYKWVASVLDESVALISLIFVCLLPPLISLSAQVRQYSLLLLFAALTLYLFKKSLAEKSPVWMAIASVCLWLALLSHYSAVFFATAFGVYALLRFLSSRMPAKILTVWALGQLGALAILSFLYREQISKLKGSSMAGEAAEGWLRRSYFHPGEDHLLLFIFGRTFGVFQFIFGHLAIGDVMGLLFIAGIVLLFRRKSKTNSSSQSEIRPRNWQLAILFILPFVLNCAAALLGVYPFGGTRHSSVLMLFAIPAISFSWLALFRQRVVLCVAAALITVAVCTAFGKPHEPNMPRADQNHAHMDEAIAFIQQQIPQSTPIFVDVQTRLLLNYYLCRDQQTLAESPKQDFDVQDCGGYQLITANLWLFNPDTFPNLWNQMIQTYGLKPGDTVWIVQAGWSVGLGPKLKATVPEDKDLSIESFGRNIQIFKLTAGQPRAFSIPEHAPSPRPD